MTNYDPRRPTGPVNAGWGGWGGGWIIAVIIVLIIIGFGWGGWYGGWYGGHARVAHLPANTAGSGEHDGNGRDQHHRRSQHQREQYKQALTDPSPLRRSGLAQAARAGSRER